MAMPVEKSLNFRGSAKRLLARLKPFRLAVGLGFVLTVTSVILSTLGPKVLGQATDLIFAGFIGGHLPAEADKAQVVAQLRAQGESTLADMLASMDVVPGRGIQFDLLSRVTNDIDNLGQTLQQTFMQMLNAVVTVIAILALMLVISPLLTLIALVSIPLSIGVTAIVAKRSQKLFIRQWDRTGALNGEIEEAFTGHELVTVFGRREEVLRRVEVTNRELRDASFGAQAVSGMIMPIMMFVGNLNYVLVAVVGGLRVTSGALSLGDVQAFIQYSRQFTQPLTQVASMANLLQSGVASAERVFELLDADEQVPEADGPEIEGASGRIEFEDVSFAYDPSKPLIEDLSLVAEPGQTVAIVGPTGAGKTTLVNLIMRFYELDAGRITLDGLDITDLSRRELRDEIGMVLQDAWVFKGTIRENIAYGRPDATEGEIRAAAEATYVDRFVQHLPDGYDTVLDDEGGNVSAGEKQLITIARAFLSNPSLLILDEATSSVDTRTELLLQQAMAALRTDRTSFVIAHRLSTIRDADLILVMEEGRIVEQGTHDELLAADGAYARLYNAQFRGAIAPEGSQGSSDGSAEDTESDAGRLIPEPPLSDPAPSVGADAP